MLYVGCVAGALQEDEYLATYRRRPASPTCRGAQAAAYRPAGRAAAQSLPAGRRCRSSATAAPAVWSLSVSGRKRASAGACTVPRPEKPERAPAALWRYTLPGGWTVLAGRTDQDNDRLSIKIAKANDWWFHVRGLPGSHVVLQVPAGRGARQRDGEGRRRDRRLAQPQARVEPGLGQRHAGALRHQAAGRAARHGRDPQGEDVRRAAGGAVSAGRRRVIEDDRPPAPPGSAQRTMSETTRPSMTVPTQCVVYSNGSPS